MALDSFNFGKELFQNEILVETVTFFGYGKLITS